MAEFIIRLVAMGGEPVNEYLRSYDPEAYDGQGHAVSTRDPGQALRFPTMEAAFDFYRAVPQARPLRPDGRPNRPLMTFTVSIEEATT